MKISGAQKISEKVNRNHPDVKEQIVTITTEVQIMLKTMSHLGKETNLKKK